MKRWIDHIGLLAVIGLLLLVRFCWVGWYAYTDYRAAQRAEAAENGRMIEQSAKAMHKAWCNHPPGGLADGSCER